MTRPLFVDCSYAGDHGIARYAREVVSRLSLGWEPLPSAHRSGRVRGVLDRSRLLLPAEATLYNPGYSAGATRAIQLLTVHDLTHLRAKGGRGRLNRLYYEHVVRPAIKKAGHVLTVSETSARDVRSWLGDVAQVHNAGNGCSEVFSHYHGVEDLGRPYYLYVGNFKSHKNPEPLFAAMRDLPGYLLVVVSSDKVSAMRLAQRNGIEDRVIVRTGVSDIELSRLYRGCTALVFPSVWEGFGLPVAEAVTAGAKVVYCSEAASVAEICDGTQIAVANADSPAAFSEALRTAAESDFVPPPRIDTYSWDAVAGRVEAVLRSI